MVNAGFVEAIVLFIILNRQFWPCFYNNILTRLVLDTIPFDKRSINLIFTHKPEKYP